MCVADGMTRTEAELYQEELKDFIVCKKIATTLLCWAVGSSLQFTSLR